MPRIAHLKNQQAVWEESGWHIEVPDDIPDDDVEEWALEQPLDRLTLDYTQNGQEVGGIDSEWEVTEVNDFSGGMATEAPPPPCPTCGKPTSYADHGDAPTWVCDGPNDSTTDQGCGAIFPVDPGQPHGA